MKKICGIYKITNKINGKCYIGSSVDIHKRWREHRARSVMKTHNYIKTYYSHLYCAFRKYGRDNFNYEIIEVVENRDELLERERYWYFVYNPEYNNMVPDRIGVCCRKKHTEETKRKISKNNAKYWENKKLPKEMKQAIIDGNKNKRIKIVMCDLKTHKEIKKFDGICNALKFLNKNPNYTSGIKSCCEGETMSSYSYFWKYDDEVNKEALK